MGRGRVEEEREREGGKRGGEWKEGEWGKRQMEREGGEREGEWVGEGARLRFDKRDTERDACE